MLYRLALGEADKEKGEPMGLKGVKKEVWKGIAAIALALFVIVTLGIPVAQNYAGRINTALGINTTVVVSGD